jgi:predicted HicB family RNase H-like nuclease
LTYLAKFYNNLQPGKMSKIFPIELDEGLHKRAKIAAIHEGVTLHDWIINILEKKLGKNGNSTSKKQENNNKRPRAR